MTKISYNSALYSAGLNDAAVFCRIRTGIVIAVSYNLVQSPISAKGIFFDN